MLPPGLTTTYQQYKRDMDVVTSWLAQTGLEVGFKFDELFPRGSSNPPQPLPNASSSKAASKRKKGVPRHKFKEKLPIAAAAAAKTGSPQTSKHSLALRHFLPLAEFIAARREKLRSGVPISLTRAINRVTRFRSDFAALLAKGGATFDVNEDEKHTFFVGILEKVQNVLSPLFGQFSSSAQDAKREAVAEEPPPTENIGTANPFNILDVYEVPELDLLEADTESTDQKQPAPASKDETRSSEVAVLDYEAEAVESAEAIESASERLMVFLTLARDIHAIREQVKGLWKRYANRELSLSPVAVATNAAVQPARDIEEQVSGTFKPDRHVADMLLKLVQSVYVMRGVDMTEQIVIGTYPSIECYDIFEFRMANALFYLVAWDGVYEKPRLQQRYNEKFGWYEKTTPYESLSHQKKFEADRAALAEVLPEFDRLGHLCFTKMIKEMEFEETDVPPVADMLIKGL